MNNLVSSPKAISIITHYESCRLKAYRDSGGVLTIGYGRTLGVKANQTITKDQALKYLEEDLKVAEHAINSKVTVPLTQDQFDAIVSFVYNEGEGHFYSSTLLRLLNNKNYSGAADELLNWNVVNGEVVSGLVYRRTTERMLFLTGNIIFGN